MKTGYIFNFTGHGAFSPNGKVPDMTQAQIDAHNAQLAADEWAAMLESGKGVLYLVDKDGAHRVADWPGAHSVPVVETRTSWHNMAGRNGRTDVWFNLDGARWHGVNIGDNQIVRCRRIKS